LTLKENTEDPLAYRYHIQNRFQWLMYVISRR